MSDYVNINGDPVKTDGQAPPKKTKHPGPLTLFMMKGRKKVVAKPYELEEAAGLCVKLAESIGWTHVTVNEDLKRPA